MSMDEGKYLQGLWSELAKENTHTIFAFVAAGPSAGQIDTMIVKLTGAVSGDRAKKYEFQYNDPTYPTQATDIITTDIILP